MAGQNHAAIDFRANCQKKRGLVADHIGDFGVVYAARHEVIFDRRDESEIRFRALGIEADESLQHIDRSLKSAIGAVGSDVFKVECSGMVDIGETAR